MKHLVFSFIVSLLYFSQVGAKAPEYEEPIRRGARLSGPVVLNKLNRAMNNNNYPQFERVLRSYGQVVEQGYTPPNEEDILSRIFTYFNGHQRQLESERFAESYITRSMAFYQRVVVHLDNLPQVENYQSRLEILRNCEENLYRCIHSETSPNPRTNIAMGRVLYEKGSAYENMGRPFNAWASYLMAAEKDHLKAKYKVVSMTMDLGISAHHISIFQQRAWLTSFLRYHPDHGDAQARMHRLLMTG